MRFQQTFVDQRLCRCAKAACRRVECFRADALGLLTGGCQQARLYRRFFADQVQVCVFTLSCADPTQTGGGRFLALAQCARQGSGYDFAQGVLVVVRCPTQQGQQFLIQQGFCIQDFTDPAQFFPR